MDMKVEPVEILIEQLRQIAEGAVEMGPQIIVALVLLIITWLIDRAVTFGFSKTMQRTRLRPALVDVLNKIVSIGVWIGGLLIAATVVFPTLTPGNLLAALGLGSIAVGLAFKDIFENFLAGLLILFREPMRMGDHIEVNNVDGQVTKITVRDTYLRRTDGQLVLLPNAMLYKNPVYVLTDQALRRTTIIAGVAYGEDVDESRKVITEAVEACDSVSKNKPIQIFAQKFADSAIEFEVTWWTGSRPVDVRSSRDEVVAAVKRGLDEAGIEIPFPYRTLVFKQQPLEIEGGQATAAARGRKGGDTDADGD